MTWREQIAGLGPSLGAFVAVHVLALISHVLGALLALALTIILCLSATQDSDAAFAAIDTLLGTILATAGACALAYGLRLMAVRHPTTQAFWTGYLVLWILFEGLLVIQGYGCFAVAPMLVHLACLLFWGTSRRVKELYP